MIFNKIGQLISEKDNFAISCHISPDGDSMGSMLGLYNLLKELGKNADMFIDEKVPERYAFLPGYHSIKQLNETKEKYSCLFVLDSGEITRIGKCKDLTSISEMVINIDHHITNDLFGNLNLVDTNASSVGEIIYQLLKTNGFKISKNTALCLYTSILTDTGGFKYSNTTALTFSIAGELIGTGINFPEINRIVFDTKTISQVRLMSRITSTLELEFNNKVGILYLTSKMLKECNAEEEDASDIVNIARDIEGVEVGIFIKEVDKDIYRVSFRSKEFVDVRNIAEYFGGGGHIKAAGCTIKGNTQNVKKIILEKLKNSLE